MMKLFGVKRDVCEHPNCKKKATIAFMTGILHGFNSWVYCKKHAKEFHKKNPDVQYFGKETLGE